MAEVTNKTLIDIMSRVVAASTANNIWTACLMFTAAKLQKMPDHYDVRIGQALEECLTRAASIYVQRQLEAHEKETR